MDVFDQISDHLREVNEQSERDRVDFTVAAYAAAAAMTPVQRRRLNVATGNVGAPAIVAAMTSAGGERAISWWAAAADDVRVQVETLTGAEPWRASVFVAAALYGHLVAALDVRSHDVVELARAAVRYDDGVQAADRQRVAAARD